MKMQDIQNAAANGSATAQAFLAQIQAEQEEAQRTQQAAVIGQNQDAAAARAKHIAELRQYAKDALARYQELADDLQALLLALHKRDRDLPADVANRLFPQHLRYVNLPRAQLGALDPIHQNFSSMETKLMEAERF